MVFAIIILVAKAVSVIFGLIASYFWIESALLPIPTDAWIGGEIRRYLEDVSRLRKWASLSTAACILFSMV